VSFCVGFCFLDRHELNLLGGLADDPTKYCLGLVLFRSRPERRQLITIFKRLLAAFTHARQLHRQVAAALDIAVAAQQGCSCMGRRRS
jgi:hypothetical protein